MRRKLQPAPLTGTAIARPLRPVRIGSFLPTAAAVALSLAALGCSGAISDGVGPDPVTAPKRSQPEPAPAPSTSTSTAPHIAPEPHQLDGETAMVRPRAVAAHRPRS